MTSGAVPADHLVSWFRDLFPDSPHIAQEIADSINENPLRIDNAFTELLGGYVLHPKDILTVALDVAPGTYKGSVQTLDVPFISMCKHHFLPFLGTIELTYVPGPSILGLGKIVRLVYCRSRRFQLQETLVQQLAEDMVQFGNAAAVFVSALAQHLCICYRGPNTAPTRNRTTYRIGSLLEGSLERGSSAD